MIRQAEMSDMDELLGLFEEAYKETPFSKMAYNKTHVNRLFACMCTFKDKFFCKVVEENGELVGILIGMVDENVWGVKTAQTLISYSRKDTHKLIRQFVQWATEKKVKQVTVSTVPGNERYEQLIDKMGFFKSGNFYTKEL